MKNFALVAFMLTIPASILAGWFNEPIPAYKQVPKEARIYLQDRNLKDLKQVQELFKVGDIIDYVNLDRNELEVFPEELLSLKGLKWLRLNGNKLTQIPSLDNLENLRRIYLRDNNLTAVPEGLKNLPRLTDIDLSGNSQIKEVPEWLAKKEGLEHLSFSRTSIIRLPEDLSAWKSLKSLQLGELQMSLNEMARIRAALSETAIVF